jgi:hypothetical protein
MDGALANARNLMGFLDAFKAALGAIQPQITISREVAEYRVWPLGRVSLSSRTMEQKNQSMLGQKNIS